ncbi:GDSL esterase/lipase APG [Hordeum vulgare]|nr:GDSL esterase/lipase APG [Hordeum vulgare]
MMLRCLLLVAIFFLTGPTTHGGQSQALVPAVFVFGDSFVDVGNNDYILTVAKANFPPYGRDFKNHVATGRFGNGKLLSDIIGEKVGFTGSPPAYLSIRSSGHNLITGANFASAGSGSYDPTSLVLKVIPLSQQLEYFKEYKSKLAVVTGKSQSQSIISGALYIISSGSNDLALNYYINPLLFKTLTIDQYADLIVSILSNTVTQLHGMGARRIGVFSLPPLGCFPAAITVFGLRKSGCVSRINRGVQIYNKKLNIAVNTLSRQYHDLKIAVLDTYKPLYNIVNSPRSQGSEDSELNSRLRMVGRERPPAKAGG